MFEKKINRTLTLEDAQHLSSHEISDIIGNYKKEDFCIDKKYYSKFTSLHYFILTIV